MANKREEQLKEITERLEQGVQELLHLSVTGNI